MNIRKLPAWKELLEWVKLWEYGEQHSHSEIAEILGIGYGTRDYYRQVTLCNRELVPTYRKYLKNRQGEGYEVIHPRQQDRESSRLVEHGRRKINWGVEVSVHTNTALLTQQENQEHAEYLARAAVVKAVLTDGTRELKVLAGRARPDLPRMLKSEN